MKIRSGFVSNSSSASFIIAIGKIQDRDKFESFLSTIDMRVIKGFSFVSLEEIQDREIESTHFNRERDKIIVESFNGSTVDIKKEDYDRIETEKDVIDKAMASLAGSKNDDIVVWYRCEEDITETEDGADYDIDLNHFDQDEQDLYNGLIEENGIKLVDKTYGAGRNG